MTPKGASTLWGQLRIKNKLNKIPPIEYGKYYHIYNKGIDDQNIFLDKDDYKHFLNWFPFFQNLLWKFMLMFSWATTFIWLCI